MLFKDITIIDENFQVKEHRYVGVKGDRIACISDTLPKEDYGEVYDGHNKLMIPAFYNMHSHLYMALMRGYGENLPLSTWLQDRIFPFEAHLTEEDMYWGTLLGTAEMLRYGIGSTQDMNLKQRAAARALTDSGVKSVVSQCLFCWDDSDYFKLPVYQQTLDTIREFSGADNGRIRVEFSLHAEYTSNEKFACAMAEAAAKHGSTMHVHVAETGDEVKQCRERYGGRSPVRYLADCGLFDVPTVAAHCVYIDDEDITILKAHGVTVGTCPKSNAKLSSGICPVTKLLDAGIRLTVNTDNRSVSATDIRREFAILTETFRLTRDEVKTLLLNAAEASFAPEALKNELMAQIDRDAENFYPLSKCYGLPAATDEEKIDGFGYIME